MKRLADGAAAGVGAALGTRVDPDGSAGAAVGRTTGVLRVDRHRARGRRARLVACRRLRRRLCDVARRDSGPSALAVRGSAAPPVCCGGECCGRSNAATITVDTTTSAAASRFDGRGRATGASTDASVRERLGRERPSRPVASSGPSSRSPRSVSIDGTGGVKSSSTAAGSGGRPAEGVRGGPGSRVTSSSGCSACPLSRSRGRAWPLRIAWSGCPGSTGAGGRSALTLGRARAGARPAPHFALVAERVTLRSGGRG